MPVTYRVPMFPADEKPVRDAICPLQAAADAAPDAPALVAFHRSYTYGELHAQVEDVRRRLLRAGLGEGTIVALALPSGTPYPILLMALLRVGAVALPLNTRFPSEYLIDVAKAVRCRDIITPYGASITTIEGKLHALCPRDLIEEDPPTPAHRALLPRERPATLVLTSGSSGKPKAALHTVENHLASAARSNANIPLETGDRWLMSLPLHHVSGLGILFRCLLGRAAAVFPGAREPIAEAIEKYGVTHVSLVATQLHRMLDEAEGVATLKRLKAILLGGGPAPAALIARAMEAGLPLYTTYGLTEMATQVTTTRPGDPPARLRSSGYPLAPDTIRIADDGTIEVYGDTLFVGYVEQDQVARPFTEDGWFRTGDLGRFDGDGYLHVLGRRDNGFISGGENIQPEEIEAFLRECPGVLEAMVVPVNDAEFGTIPAAFVRIDGDGPPDTAALRDELMARLPKFKVPRHFYPWPEDLMTGGIKPRRTDFIARARGMVGA